MSYSRQSMGYGSRSARGYEFGRTYVVRPKGKHQATLVWLHGLGDNGSSLQNVSAPGEPTSSKHKMDLPNCSFPSCFASGWIPLHCLWGDLCTVVFCPLM